MFENKVLHAQSRGNIYTFLAGIFLQEPSVSQFPQYIEALQDLLKEVETYPVTFGAVIPEDNHEFAERLRQEYYDCFFVPMSGQYVPPYESALLNYRTGERKPFGTLNSMEASHVAACYVAVDFHPQALNVFTPLKEIHLPDHVGFELAFMAMLCVAEQMAWDKENQVEALKWQTFELQFLREHLNQWIENFARALQDHAPGYYAQAARAAEIWVASDLREIEIDANQGGDEGALKH